MGASGVLDTPVRPAEPLLDSASARRVGEFRVSEDVQEQVNALAERANEGLLRDAERAEYEAIVNAADFIELLKLKALRTLESRPEA